MRKFVVVLISGVALFMFTVQLSSCKKSDPPAKLNLTMGEATKTVKESDGIIEVTVKLDRPAAEHITIDYELTGTAQDDGSATSSSDPSDYVIVDNYLEVEILKGESTGTIQIQLFSDDLIEDDETIIVTIKSTDSDNVLFDVGTKETITVQQEDGMVVTLGWPAPTTTASADMDLFVRIGETTAHYDGIVTGSVYRSFEQTEFVFIPKIYTGKFFGLTYTNSTFGFTYNYYAGTLDPLVFTVKFIEIVNDALEPEAQRQTFTGTYTAANINAWTGTSYPSTVVQTFQNVAGSFTTPTDIVPPPSGSRYGTIPTLNDFIPHAHTYLKRQNASGTKRVLPKKFLDQL